MGNLKEIRVLSATFLVLSAIACSDPQQEDQGSQSQEVLPDDAIINVNEEAAEEAEPTQYKPQKMQLSEDHKSVVFSDSSAFYVLNLAEGSGKRYLSPHQRHRITDPSISSTGETAVVGYSAHAPSGVDYFRLINLVSDETRYLYSPEREFRGNELINDTMFVTFAETYRDDPVYLKDIPSDQVGLEFWDPRRSLGGTLVIVDINGPHVEMAHSCDHKIDRFMASGTIEFSTSNGRVFSRALFLLISSTDQALTKAVNGRSRKAKTIEFEFNIDDGCVRGYRTIDLASVLGTGGVSDSFLSSDPFARGLFHGDNFYPFSALLRTVNPFEMTSTSIWLAYGMDQLVFMIQTETDYSVVGCSLAGLELNCAPISKIPHAKIVDVE